MQEEQERKLDTARECAKDFLRPLVEAGWSLNRIISDQRGITSAEYALWIGKNGAITDQHYQQRIIQRGQLVVTHVGETSCFVELAIAEIVAEIRDEERGYRQPTLVEIFSQEQQLVKPATTEKHHKRLATYRSYMGGNCENCDEPLGLIEVEGGRDRHYCNDRCRVQHHRKQKTDQKRTTILQYNSELREYWKEHNIRGEVLQRLQEILLNHGKNAARAATDAVLVACAVQQQVGNGERDLLIDDVLLGGERVSHEAILFDDFRIEQGLDAWCEFVSGASVTSLRIVKEYIKHRQYAQQGRKRFEELNRNLSQA